MIKALSLAPIGMSAIAALRQAAAALEPRGRKTPALFVGHGSPMNAVRDNVLFGTTSSVAPRSSRSRPASTTLPLLYALAVKGEAEPIAYFNDAATMGSISMRSLIIG